MSIIRKFFAETLGTFILVLLGCGTAVMTQASLVNITGYLTTAVAFGISAIIGYALIGHITGAQMNPAITIAMVFEKRTKFGDGLVYIIAQVFGATLAMFFLKWILSASDSLAYCLNSLYQGNMIKTILIELAMTTILVLVALAATDKKFRDSEHGAFYVGATLTALHVFGMAFDGVSVNPARTLGTALAFGKYAFDDLPGVLIGSSLGGILAWIIYQLIKPSKADEPVIVNAEIVHQKETKEPAPVRKKAKPPVEETVVPEPEPAPKPKVQKQKKEHNLKSAISSMLFEEETDDIEEEEPSVKQRPAQPAKSSSTSINVPQRRTVPTHTSEMSLPHYTTSGKTGMSLPTK